MTGKLRAALLIDADNLPITQVEEALDKLEVVCNPIIRKAFGDFTGSAKNWSADFLLKSGITPVQHFPISRFKNGADIAMCIAAMDIVHTRSVDAIVLFSSDSDFGPLASRIRETGMEVIGIGDLQTNEVFRACFDTFIIVKPATVSQQTAKPIVVKKKQPKASVKQGSLAIGEYRTLPEAERIIRFEITNCEPDGGWVKMSELGTKLRARSPKFIISHYGAASLTKLIDRIGGFTIQSKHKPPRVKVDPSKLSPKN
mgnify:CR=1 FL=1